MQDFEYATQQDINDGNAIDMEIQYILGNVSKNIYTICRLAHGNPAYKTVLREIAYAMYFIENRYISDPDCTFTHCRYELEMEMAYMSDGIEYVDEVVDNEITSAISNIATNINRLFGNVVTSKTMHHLNEAADILFSRSHIH
jgi:hypothetical protein